MSHAAYLVTYPAGKFSAIEKRLSAKLKRTRGSALVPVSPMRSVLPAVCANEIAGSTKTSLPVFLRRLGATEMRPVSNPELMSLLAWREPGELPGRPKPMNRKRITASYDWHLGETGLDRAWTHWGDPDQISWGGVVVGHIDTGFTRHPKHRMRARNGGVTGHHTGCWLCVQRVEIDEQKQQSDPPVLH